MKFFPSKKIQSLDQLTIMKEPIAAIDLMERAGTALFDSFIIQFDKLRPVCVCAGSGNNGGDALVLARLLLECGYRVRVFLIRFGSLSVDCELNRRRLVYQYPDSLQEIEHDFPALLLSKDTVLVDGLLGSGLNRSLSGLVAKVVCWINATACKVVAIDVPSGLRAEACVLTDELVVQANFTYSLQFPKLAFFFAENDRFIGEWQLLDIGIHPEAIAMTKSDFSYLDDAEVKLLLKKRPRHGHKGTFGHVLVVAGRLGMGGASILTAKAALRTGAGLVTIHGPSENRIPVQTALPEVIFSSDPNPNHVTHVVDFTSYSAVAIGPGLGVCRETETMFADSLRDLTLPTVIDADALNIISKNLDLLAALPVNSILTPHPKEFDSLFGKSCNSAERLKKAVEMAKLWKLVIVLKGAYTQIITPKGHVYVNSTGNPGMATAGSGDVLTGIIAGLLAQGYSTEEASVIGVYLHGRAGDLALHSESVESLIASDIIAFLGRGFCSLR